ncbi:hypothetical protein ACVGVM_16415 [Pseudonocardia bannensis]|uniref:DUF4258 domain-containing protein n=1 Tax=Pseudonocardia bannensis TaxID=630973 RepID=A0A848DMD9_9PSEU|nr:hypothetical protein [Pseudonocardia bannensis]NMH93892.1 hypothetical protein [Pseudonocardia bannensis]
MQSSVRISRGARKHGIAEGDIRAVLAAPLRTVRQGGRTLLIGLAPNRDLLEIVVDNAADAGPDGVVVHAMRLRPKHYEHLRPPSGSDQSVSAAASSGSPDTV